MYITVSIVKGSEFVFNRACLRQSTIGKTALTRVQPDWLPDIIEAESQCIADFLATILSAFCQSACWCPF